MVTEIDGRNMEPQIGSFVKPDGWTYGERLIAGDSFSPFRIPVTNGGPITSLAIRVEVTGRTFQRKNSMRTVRVRIIFPGDCSPDTVTRGVMEIPY